MPRCRGRRLHALARPRVRAVPPGTPRRPREPRRWPRGSLAARADHMPARERRSNRHDRLRDPRRSTHLGAREKPALAPPRRARVARCSNKPQLGIASVIARGFLENKTYSLSV